MIKFTHRWLQSFIKTHITQQKLIKTLNIIGLETKKQNYNYPNIIEVVPTPNRGDCTSIYGIARELAAKGTGNLQERHTRFTKKLFYIKKKLNTININQKSNLFYKILFCKLHSVDNTQKVNKSISSHLQSINQQQHNTLDSIANLVMHEFGQPSNIYDADKIIGNIQIRNSRKKEKFWLTHDQTLILPEGILLITDTQKILSIAGIIQSIHSRVDKNTKNVVIEAGIFIPDNITKSTRVLNIHTEASYRFERRVDYGNLRSCMQHLVEEIVKYCGGIKHSSLLITGIRNKYPKKIRLNYGNIEKIIGYEIDQETINSTITKLGFRKHKDNVYHIPTWRQGETESDADIAEETIRILGLQKLGKSRNLHNTFVQYNKTKNNVIYNDVREIMTNRKAFEVISWSFISEEHTLVSKEYKPVRIINPINNELSAMRNSLLPGLLKIIKKNTIQNTKNISIFEIGDIYYKDHYNVPRQKKCFAVARSGNISERNTLIQQRAFDFYDIKDDCFAVLDKIGIFTENLTIRKTKKTRYHSGESATICNDENCVIGHIGSVHPRILEHFQIKQKVIFGEMFLDVISKIDIKQKPELTIYKIQEIYRDFTVHTKKHVESMKIINIVNSLNIDLIKEVRIFDVYENDETLKGMKAVSFTVKIQPKKRSLTEQEIQQLSSNIMDNLQKLLPLDR